MSAQNTVQIDGETVTVHGQALQMPPQQVSDLREWVEAGLDASEFLTAAGIEIPQAPVVLSSDEQKVVSKLLALRIGFQMAGRRVLWHGHDLGEIFAEGGVRAAVQTFVKLRLLECGVEVVPVEVAVSSMPTWRYEALVKDDPAFGKWAGTGFPAAQIILGRFTAGGEVDYTSQLGSFRRVADVPQLVEPALQAVEQALDEWLKGHRQAEVERNRQLTAAQRQVEPSTAIPSWVVTDAELRAARKPAGKAAKAAKAQEPKNKGKGRQQQAAA